MIFWRLTTPQPLNKSKKLTESLLKDTILMLELLTLIKLINLMLKSSEKLQKLIKFFQSENQELTMICKGKRTLTHINL